MPKKSGKRGRGRPAHQPTVATRRKVSIAAGGGMRHEDIAIALGIDSDTLRKHYETELSVGAAQRRMEALEGVHKAAKRGSSSAAKVYLASEPEIAVPPSNGDGKPAAPAVEGKEPKLGKKEQADRDARVAHKGDERWGDLLEGPPPPGTPIQ